MTDVGDDLEDENKKVKYELPDDNATDLVKNKLCHCVDRGKVYKSVIVTKAAGHDDKRRYVKILHKVGLVLYSDGSVSRLSC